MGGGEHKWPKEPPSKAGCLSNTKSGGNSEKYAKGLPLRSRNQGGEGGGGDCSFSVLSFGELLTLKTMCCV